MPNGLAVDPPMAECASLFRPTMQRPRVSRKGGWYNQGLLPLNTCSADSLRWR